MQSGPIAPWSYDPSLEQPRDQLRYVIGDTEANQPLLYDGELEWQLAQQPDLYLAAAGACEAIAAKLAKRVDVSVGGQSAGLGKKMEAYREMADRFRVEAGRHGGGGAVTVGALVVLESRTLEAAAGVTPAFRRNQFGHPGNET